MTSEKKGLAVSVRQNLLLGVLTLSPLVISMWILVGVVRFLDSAIYVVIPWNFYVPGLGLIIAFLLVLLAGVLARTYFGKFLNHVIDGLFSKVPLVRGLYSGTKQISSAFFSEDAVATFKHVVWVPFPSESSRTIGFLAGRVSEDETFVFIPTAPNPTSGYVVAYKNSQLVDSHMEVDEAFKVILSCGFVSNKS